MVAADAGVDRARALGWRVDVAVGDFDSVGPAGRAALDGEISDVRSHPVDKDATDLELALDVAAELASAPPADRCRVLVLGLEGGRPDHALANLLVAASDRFAALDIELVLAEGRAWVVRGELVGHVEAGRTLSLVPVARPGHRVDHRGPLAAALLDPRGRDDPRRQQRDHRRPAHRHRARRHRALHRPPTTGDPPMTTTRRAIASVLAAGLLIAGCGDDDDTATPTAPEEGVTITLITHDSFDLSEEVLDAFTEESGITVRLLPSGDAGSMVNQAILTKGSPQGDVLFGIDNTFLSRALDEDLFLAYESPALEGVDDARCSTPSTG